MDFQSGESKRDALVVNEIESILQCFYFNKLIIFIKLSDKSFQDFYKKNALIEFFRTAQK